MTATCSAFDDSPATQTRHLLRAAAIARPDGARQERIMACARKIEDWQHLASAAEHHNLSPLVHHHLQGAGDIDPMGRRALGALAIRHRHANATLSQVTCEILGAFDTAGIDCLVLKGMALSHLVYPEARLRPMRDVDLLVPAELAARGQALLGELGFSLPDSFDYGLGGGRYMRNHHHLPIASLKRDGLTISVELHTDALSGDYPESLSYPVVRHDAREFVIGDTPALAMGHEHMLTHLLRHLLEPVHEVRLGGIADILTYADYFRDEIDWNRLARGKRFVPNAIALLHFVSPLPSALSHLAPDVDAPDGAGFGMRPLGDIVSSSAGVCRRLSELTSPPAWWLLAHYGAAPGDSVRRVQITRHGPRLVRLFWRRLRAGLGW